MIFNQVFFIKKNNSNKNCGSSKDNLFKIETPVSKIDVGNVSLLCLF